jgi:hypothetical protein
MEVMKMPEDEKKAMLNFNPWLIALLGFVLGVFTIFLVYPRGEKIVKMPVREKITLRDTILKIIKPEPLVINKTRLKIIRQSDTIIQSKPFTAELDTVISRDTMKFRYEYPQNVFSFYLAKKPDTLRYQQIVVRETIEKERPWWEIPVSVGGGIIAGVLIGKLSGK